MMSDHFLAANMERTVARNEASLRARMYVNRAGDNLTYLKVVEILGNQLGAPDDAIDYLRVGGIYHNGDLWFQRLD